LDVHSSTIALKVGWHLAVSIVVPNVVDFGLAGVYCSYELVDVAVSFSESLVGDGCASVYCGDEAICDGVRCVSEVIVLHVEDSFHQSRGYWGVVTNTIGGNVYTEWGWQCDFLNGWSGGVWYILD